MLSTRLLSAPLRGALFVVIASFGFSIMNLLVRMASEELPVMEVTFFRNFFAFIFMLPWLLRVGIGELKTKRIKLHFIRSLNGIAAMAVWFLSISLLPMAQAVALNFTVPLFATLGAVIFLKEVVKLRRWIATAFGFVGVLVILRPGTQDVSILMLLPVLAAALMAISVLLIKTLTQTEKPSVTVFYTTIFMTLFSLVPAIFVWEWPSQKIWFAVAGVGLLGAIANLLVTKALAITDASSVMPFDYTRLPFMALIAFFAVGEVPDIWTWVGGGIIAASAIYIAHREARIRRRAQAELSTRDTLRPASHAPRGTV
ncbi:DMT family transporter [Kiloniella laminariae]|uniref:DMT family transporter n=1 Tax=Kiloniella laminariae TaxID=454162 RepID=A0ABT4LJB0_9PROT|nr:DMT family transporter [Kiloniella laminariae]MCZ4281025.1 DMT family transporter [Kiloniella laminariae]